MTSLSRRLLALSLAMVASTTSGFAAFIHFTAGNGWDHYTYDTGTGERVFLGSMGFTNMPVEFTPDGQLYGADNGGAANPLFRINPVPTTNPNPVWLTEIGNMRQAGHGLAYDPMTDSLLLSTLGSDPRIYSVTISPFSISLFGTPTGIDRIDGLTILGSDTMIAGFGEAPAGSILTVRSYNSAPNQLYILDRSTLAATNLGTTNGDLGIATAGGTKLYISSLTGLYERDLATGAETLLFDDPSLYFISSLAYMVPEPSIGLLMSTGLIGMALRRRRGR